MRPVNLLPEELRPRERTEGRGPAHIVLGVLGVLLVMSVVYALSLNHTNSTKTEIARAKSEIEQAKAQVAASAEFGDFHSIKETREASVKQLASGRFDFERLMREMALVLPAHTWLLDASASTSSGPESGAAAGGSTPTPTPTPAASAGTDAAGAGTPTLNLSGCALQQKNVAVLLVRLRKLYRAEDVDLEESAQDTSNQGSGARAQTSSDSAGGAEDSCGPSRFKFTVHVKFSPTPDGEKPAGGKVPTTLGGGS